jgi:hypothetical protein
MAHNSVTYVPPRFSNILFLNESNLALSIVGFVEEGEVEEEFPDTLSILCYPVVVILFRSSILLYLGTHF